MKKLSLKIPLRGDTTAKHNHSVQNSAAFPYFKDVSCHFNPTSLIISHLKTVKLSKSIFTPKNSWRS